MGTSFSFPRFVKLEVYKTAEQLIQCTDNDDILIFIGQTPHYLYATTQKFRTSISIPFSGRPFGDFQFYPSSTQLNNFKNLLIEKGITDNIIRNNNIILIDHSHSGNSITAFSKTVNKCFNTHKTFQFINVISPIQQKYRNNIIISPDRKYVKTIGYLIMPNLIAFANESNKIYNTNNEKTNIMIPRSIPHYGYWKWNYAPNYSELSYGICLMNDLIEDYDNFDQNNLNWNDEQIWNQIECYYEAI